MYIGTVKQIWRYAVKSMAGEQLDTCSVHSNGILGDRGWALRDDIRREITSAKRMPVLMQCSARYHEPPSNGNIPHADIILPDGSLTSTDAAAINEKLSQMLGRSVSIWPIQPASNLDHYRRRSPTARVLGRLAKYRLVRASLPTLTSFGPANAELRRTFSREADEPIPDVSKLPPEILEFSSPLGTYFDAFPIHLMTTASLDAMAGFNPGSQWDVRRFRPNFLIETSHNLKGLLESEWTGQRLRLGNIELRCEIPTMRCGMTMTEQKNLPKDPSILRSIVKDANQNLGIYARVSAVGEVKVGDAVDLM